MPLSSGRWIRVGSRCTKEEGKNTDHLGACAATNCDSRLMTLEVRRVKRLPEHLQFQPLYYLSSSKTALTSYHGGGIDKNCLARSHGNCCRRTCVLCHIMNKANSAQSNPLPILSISVAKVGWFNLILFCRAYRAWNTGPTSHPYGCLFCIVYSICCHL